MNNAKRSKQRAPPGAVTFHYWIHPLASGVLKRHRLLIPTKELQLLFCREHHVYVSFCQLSCSQTCRLKTRQKSILHTVFKDSSTYSTEALRHRGRDVRLRVKSKKTSTLNPRSIKFNITVVLSKKTPSTNIVKLS